MSLRVLLPKAISTGDLETVRTLCAADVDINAPLSAGDHVSPLALAVHHNHIDIVEELLQSGANVDGCLMMFILFSQGALHSAAIGSGNLLTEENGQNEQEEQDEQDGQDEEDEQDTEESDEQDHEDPLAVYKLKHDITPSSDDLEQRPCFCCLDSQRLCLPLNVAIENGNLVIAEMLLEQGATLNIIDINGETPLAHAFAHAHGNQEMIDLLLKFIKKCDLPDSEGNNSLLFASGRGQKQIVEALLQLAPHGFNINYQNSSGYTALHFAVQWNNVDVVEILLDHGCDVNYQNCLSLSPVSTAASMGNVEMLEVFKNKGVDFKMVERLELCRAEEHDPMLHLVAKSRKREAVKFFIDLGVPIDKLNVTGDTALCQAIASGDLGCCEELISAGCNVQLPAIPREQPLCLAVKINKPPIISLLVSAGADIDASDLLGQTALMYAVQMKKTAAAKQLLQLGCNVNVQNMNGNTAFMLALRKQYVELLDLLLERDAHINDVVNQSGLTPLTLAVRNASSPYFVQMLLAAGASVTLPVGADDLRMPWVEWAFSDGVHVRNVHHLMKVTHLLLYAGCRWPSFLAKRMELYECAKIQVPLTLARLCRIQVREKLTRFTSTKKQFRDKLDGLELPMPLTDFLLMQRL